MRLERGVNVECFAILSVNAIREWVWCYTEFTNTYSNGLKRLVPRRLGILLRELNLQRLFTGDPLHTKNYIKHSHLWHFSKKVGDPSDFFKQMYIFHCFKVCIVSKQFFKRYNTRSIPYSSYQWAWSTYWPFAFTAYRFAFGPLWRKFWESKLSNIFRSCLPFLRANNSKNIKYSTYSQNIN